MTTNSAIVDDRDPLIKYTGTWGQAGSSEEYSETTTFSVVPGSTATFPFTGSSVTVYGTIAANNFSTQATWSFAVDSSVTGTYTPPANMTSDIHHQALWTTPASSIANGTHSLLITQTASSSTQVLYLDYIIFTTTSLDVGSYFIDDRDPRVVYSPPWQLFGSEGDFMHTSQETSGAGDYLTLEFEGRSIQFYGGVTSTTENASMTIDGGPPTFWIPPTSATQTNNLIYSSGTLLPGNHTLVVTATTNQPVWADYFLVVPNPVDFVAPVSSSAPASNSVTASSAPSSSSTSQSSHKSTPVGEIVGPIIGVLAVVAILAAIFFRLRRRHHYEGHTDPSMMSDVEAAAPVPAFGGAGPPPSLSHGYSTELGLGPFATPNQPISSANADASGSGASQHEPGSYFGTPLAPNRATSSHGAASASSPGTIRSSGPNSTTSEDVYNDVNVNVPPTVRSGMVPSNKLLREAQRAAQWHVSSPSTSGSVTSSGVQDVPPNYSE